MPEYEEKKPWPKLELSPTKTEKTMRKICRAALDTYGAAAQTLMCMEEMSELHKELCKNSRGVKNTKNIAEEIADVLITIKQMAILHGCESEVLHFVAVKVQRLEERIKNERNN